MREIRTTRYSQVFLAAFYGVSQQRISQIRRGLGWKHVQVQR